MVEIISGKILPGDKLPSVREYALLAGVNPNTMQKALSELEEIGLVETQRNSGRTVTMNQEMINTMRIDLATKAASRYLEYIQEIGLTRDEAMNIIKEVNPNG